MHKHKTTPNSVACKIAASLSHAIGSALSSACMSPSISCLTLAGSIRAYFKGNGTNVLKIAPETSIKLALNDHLRHHIHSDNADVAPWERMLCGGVSGAIGQVGRKV